MSLAITFSVDFLFLLWKTLQTKVRSLRLSACSYYWSIHNFSMHPAGRHKTKKSQYVISTTTVIGIRWILKCGEIWNQGLTISEWPCLYDYNVCQYVWSFSGSWTTYCWQTGLKSLSSCWAAWKGRYAWGERDHRSIAFWSHRRNLFTAPWTILKTRPFMVA